MSAVVNMEDSRIKNGHVEVIHGVEFHLRRSGTDIFVYIDGDRIDNIVVADGVTTVQHFQEQVMWWLYEHNQV